jgi:hypothetical protein
MPTRSHPLGARRLHLRDWPFGAVGRRLLIEALLDTPQPESGWRKTQLEERIGVRNGGLDVLLAGAVDLGLARVENGRILTGEPQPTIAPPLLDVLRAAQALPDRPPNALPRRPYRTRR